MHSPKHFLTSFLLQSLQLLHSLVRKELHFLWFELFRFQITNWKCSSSIRDRNAHRELAVTIHLLLNDDAINRCIRVAFSISSKMTTIMAKNEESQIHIFHVKTDIAAANLVSGLLLSPCVLSKVWWHPCCGLVFRVAEHIAHCTCQSYSRYHNNSRENETTHDQFRKTRSPACGSRWRVKNGKVVVSAFSQTQRRCRLCCDLNTWNTAHIFIRPNIVMSLRWAIISMYYRVIFTDRVPQIM